MDKLIQQIARIESKVKQLKGLYQSELDKNKELTHINKNLKESLNQVSREKERLEVELRTLADTQQARQGDELSSYKKSFVKELDAYLSELEKCIDLVENS